MKRNLLIAVLISACVAKASAGQPRPNVLFIVCDDLNTHVSTSGYDNIQTPTFDALAKDSMTFSHAFCQYPVCGPSRASFLHGLYPESTGVLDNKADIRQTRPNTASLPQHFKQNGYWTASVGKVFHSPRHEHGEVAWDEHRRFDNDELPVVTAARKRFVQEFGSVDERRNRVRWKEVMKAAMAPLAAQTPPGHGPSGLRDQQHRDGKNARQVAAWLKQKSYGDKPFFIALGIQKPHVPFLAPDKYFDLYPREKIQFHRDPANLWNSIPRDAINGRYREFGFELGVENEPRRREFMQAYHACVSFIDAQIGIVLQQLKDERLWDNTIIVLTSDHGYHLGDHFLWGKVTLFDVGAKVPFIIRVPGMTKAAIRSDAMVELVDVFPTLTQLAGLKTPQHLQGRSLVPLLEDPSRDHSKDFAYSVVTRRDDLGYAIRNQTWRYGKWPSGEELYDLRNDPHERNNLAKDPEHSDRLHNLRAVLAAKQKTARSRRHANAKVADAEQPVVLAYYYPWYHEGDWSRHDYAGTPTLGKYGTDSPRVAEQHVQWASDHGIDGLFVSWWGKEHLTEKHLDRGLLKASNLDRTQFALFYESLGLLDKQDGKQDGVCDFSNPQVLAALIADFGYLAKKYFNHPRYLKLSGRPVVGMYVTRTFKGFTREHLDKVREAIDSDVYVIADEAFIHAQSSPETARNGKEIFDAYTAYNMFENANVRDGDTALTYQSREAFPIFRQWAKRTTFIPAIFPSYKDFRGHKSLAGNPQDFATLLDAASSIASIQRSSIPSIVLITSFNEWWEGTTIEPADEYGKAYLDVIRQFKQQSMTGKAAINERSFPVHETGSE